MSQLQPNRSDGLPTTHTTSNVEGSSVRLLLPRVHASFRVASNGPRVHAEGAVHRRGDKPGKGALPNMFRPGVIADLRSRLPLVTQKLPIAIPVSSGVDGHLREFGVPAVQDLCGYEDRARAARERCGL